ncbi:BgTH12-02410 [Blumeria graminis f. sp. triticale]|uniref:BgTH12-02410 n=1 Tax=Blumeria graminis f. sp. triticale TaxID=1689686 RepID=A0A9W4D124_BLUGR|nr:BgTH12-02410 [Blumeria graminis f. sp. triticale]
MSGTNTSEAEAENRIKDYKIAQLALRLEGTSISSRHFDSLDPDLWGEPVNKLSSAVALTTYAVKLLTDWEEYKEHGEDLFLLFKEEFADWTSDMFGKIKSGVYTGKKTIPIGIAMVTLLNCEELPEWPQIKEIDLPDQGQQFQQQKVAPKQTGYQSEEGQALNSMLPTLKQQSQPPFRPIRSQSPYPWENDQPRPAPGTLYPQRPAVRAVVDYKTFDDYNDLPPRDVQNERVDANTQTSFIKLWNRNQNYTGEAYDLLDNKVRYFLRICYNLSIPVQYFHGLFSHILDGEAQAFYLSYVPKDDTFYNQYTKMKYHFDTEINHHQYYTDWTNITFANFRSKTPDKPLQEVLDAFLKKKQLCQRALGEMYIGESLLRTQIITNCKGVPELEVALFNPGKSCEELFSQLRSAIEIYSNRSPNQFTQYNNEFMGDNQFFLDRRYTHNRLHRGKYGTRIGNGNSFQGGNCGNPSGDSRQQQRQLRWKKKCFVCGKEGCWSTKHPKEDRNRAKSQYMSHCIYSDSQPPIDFAIYLAGYEGIGDETEVVDKIDYSEENNLTAEDHDSFHQVC